MKKTLLTFAFALGCIYSNGQNFIPASGNVGLGTGNPQFNLEINSEMPFLKIRSSVYTYNPAVLTIKGGIIFNMENPDKTAGILEAIPPGYHVPGILFGTKMSYAEPGPGSTDWYHRMFIHPNGNIGIGTTSPQSILHIIGNGVDMGMPNAYGQGLLVEGKTGGRFADKGAVLEFVIPANTDGTNPWGQGRIATVAGNSNNGSAIGKMILGTRKLFNRNGVDNWYYGNDIVIDGAGNIGVGTTDPKGYKLAVAGNMIAESVKVKLQGTWPDYVFKEDYKLPTLEETERHIKETGHLPGIPSAAEVKVGGIEVGEMNAKLLKKVEELTLYLIDQNKRLEKQEQKIKELSDANNKCL